MLKYTWKVKDFILPHLFYFKNKWKIWLGFGMQCQNMQCFCLNTPVLKSSLCVNRLGVPKETGFFCPPLGVKGNLSGTTHDHTSCAVSWNWPVAVGSDLHHHGDPAGLPGYSSHHSHQADAYNPWVYWTWGYQTEMSPLAKQLGATHYLF